VGTGTETIDPKEENMNIVTGFHPQFEAPILANDKLSTIRKRRFGRQIRVGDVLKMFTGIRTKHCRHFADRVVTMIEDIHIAEAYIHVNHVRLDDDQCRRLYDVDGF